MRISPVRDVHEPHRCCWLPTQRIDAGRHAAQVLVGQRRGPPLEVPVRGGDVGALGQDALDEALDQLHPVGLAEPGRDEDDHPAVLPEAAGGLAPARARPHLDRRTRWAAIAHLGLRLVRELRQRRARRRRRVGPAVVPPSNSMSPIDADAVAQRKTLRVNFLRHCPAPRRRRSGPSGTAVPRVTTASASRWR